jgi:hypothetical protein
LDFDFGYKKEEEERNHPRVFYPKTKHLNTPYSSFSYQTTISPPTTKDGKTKKKRVFVLAPPMRIRVW